MAIENLRKDEQSKEVSKWVTIQKLVKRILVHRKEIYLVLVLMGVIIIINLINPIFIKIAIDRYIKEGNVKGLILLAGIAIGVNILNAMAIKGRIIIMSRVSNKTLVTIRQELYEHIQKLSFDFFDNRPVGKILARVIGDVNSLKDMLTNSVVILVPDLIQICVTLIIMFALSARLAIAAVILLPFLIMIMVFIEVKAHKRWRVFRKKNATMNAFIHENFSGVKVVQSYAAEAATSKEFEQVLEEHRQSFIYAVRLNDFFWPLVEISWGIGTALVFLIGVKMSQDGGIEIGTLLAFTAYISMFWNPIMNLSNFYNQLTTNLAGAERIFDILAIEPAIKDQAQARTMPPIEGKLVFDHVTFGYTTEVDVLKDLSFEIKQGETIALVGPTGAGKTTIVNLMSRFYEIQKGSILIDDVNIQEVGIESLRSQMGIMTQDTFLFSGSIRENIRYGKLNATDEEIEVAARAVSAHEFIMACEDGYDTRLNERGSRLSMGQRKLIAFARTMLSQPRILILDEATSSIDTYIERLVQQGIRELLKDRTSFVIAHRLSTIKKADRIFVVDKQGILESGSHEALLELGEVYSNLYQVQFKVNVE